MKKSKTATKSETGAAGSATGSPVFEISRFALGIGVILALLVGVWGFFCLIGGVCSCGGLTGAIEGWIKAVFGS